MLLNNPEEEEASNSTKCRETSQPGESGGLNRWERSDHFVGLSTATTPGTFIQVLRTGNLIVTKLDTSRVGTTRKVVVQVVSLVFVLRYRSIDFCFRGFGYFLYKQTQCPPIYI